MRIKSLSRFLLSAFCFLICVRSAHAQFIGYTSPQTVSQTLFPAGTACTGATQIATVPNLGQTQHTLIIETYNNTQSFTAYLQGSWDGVNFVRFSDEMDYSFQGRGGIIQASGYYPSIQAVVVCTAGVGTTFALFYSGTSVSPTQLAGAALQTAIEKNIVNAGNAGTSDVVTVVAPFGNLAGSVLLTYQGAGPANSTLRVQCNDLNASALGHFPPYIFPLAVTTAILQTFPIPSAICPGGLTVAYTAGGANASIVSIDYLFIAPGLSQSSATGQNLSSAFNLNASIAEKGPRWSVLHTPAVSTQATASKTAGAAGVRHVADCVSISAGASTAPTATQLTINLRDGATGAGTILWSTEITAGATATNHGNVNVCGLNLIGSAATAMTLEYGAALANEFEAVTLSGYDVQ